MANKRINDLQARSDFDATCNVAVDDASQTWRATGAQILAFIKAQNFADASIITGQTADTDPQSGDSLLSYDLSATALKKVTKANLLKKAIVAKTTTYTATAEDDVITVSAASAWTLTLPTAVGISGKELRILRTDSAPANVVTLDANGSETIQGSLTVGLYTKGEMWHIISDGANWQVLEHKCDTPWESYTPTFVGFGTVTNISMFSRRVKDTLELRGNWTNGSPTGVTATMSLGVGGANGNATISSTKIPTGVTVLAGTKTSSSNLGGMYTILAAVSTSATDLFFGYMNGSHAGNSAETGSSVGNNAENNTMFAAVPITGWSA